jgi:hypothetical protein
MLKPANTNKINGNATSIHVKPLHVPLLETRRLVKVLNLLPLVAITVFSMGGGGGAAVKEKTRKKMKN